MAKILVKLDEHKNYKNSGKSEENFSAAVVILWCSWSFLCLYFHKILSRKRLRLFSE